MKRDYIKILFWVVVIAIILLALRGSNGLPAGTIGAIDESPFHVVNDFVVGLTFVSFVKKIKDYFKEPNSKNHHTLF